MGDVKRSKAEYRLAIVSDSSNLPAWEGLAELQMANGEVAESQQTFEQLVGRVVNNCCMPVLWPVLWLRSCSGVR